jgi:phage terminase large subunit-like protein
VRGLRKQAQRPTMCVVDDIETRDLVKNERRQREIAQWIEKDLRQTMDGYPRRLIKANNKFAKRMVQTLLQERNPKWHIHHVKAFDPFTFEPTWSTKYTAEYWSKMHGETPVAVNAEYQHEAHEEGAIFSEEQINWGKAPRIDHFDLVVGHWDIAYAGTKTADYNAVRLWGVKGNQFWLLDCFVKQSKMRAAVDWMIDKDKQLPSSVQVQWRFESQFWNDEVNRTIRDAVKDNGHDLRLAKVDAPKANKYDRMLSMESYYQNGRIWYSENLKGHGDTMVGISQLVGIEPGYNGHDDAPDADEQAIRRLSAEVRVHDYMPPLMGEHRSQRITY